MAADAGIGPTRSSTGSVLESADKVFENLCSDISLVHSIILHF